MTTTVKVEPGACGLECRMEIRVEGKESVFVKITSQCERVVAFSRDLANLEIKAALAPAHKNPILAAGGLSGCHPSCPVPLAVIKGVEVECELALPKTSTIQIEKL